VQLSAILNDPEVISGDKLFFDLYASFSREGEGVACESFVDPSGGILVQGVKEAQLSHQLFFLKYLFETQSGSEGKFLRPMDNLGGVGILIVAALDDLRYLPYCILEDDPSYLLSLFETLNFANAEVAKVEATEGSIGKSFQARGVKAKSYRAKKSAGGMREMAAEQWAATSDQPTSTREVAEIILAAMEENPQLFGLSHPVKIENVLKKIRPVAPPGAGKRGPKPRK
jgi:hypothetical protein